MEDLKNTAPEPLMSLQECKEITAKKYGYETWELLRFSRSMSFDKERIFHDEAAELYAQQSQAPPIDQNWFDWLCASIPHLKDTGAYKFWISQAFEAMVEQSQGREWVSVEDRLPDVERGEFLVYGKGEQWLTNWYKGLGWNLNRSRGIVTHWMPLPNPPSK